MSNEPLDELLEGIGITRILLAVSGLSILSLLTDGALGGGIILDGFSLGLDFMSFFVSLLISSVIFIIFWVLISKRFRDSLRFSNSVTWVITVVFLLSASFAFSLNSKEIFLIVTIPFFNLLSFSLFSFTTRAISKTAMYPQRGVYTSVGAVIGLALSAIILSISGITGRLRSYSIMAMTLALALIPIWLIIKGWYPLRDKGVRYIGTDQEDILRLSSKSLKLAVASSSLFLIGSGAAHGAILQTVVGIAETNREVSYLFAIPFILVISYISDKVGRYALLIGAVSMNSVSQIIAYSGGDAQLVAAFEITGYYLAIVFMLMKISEELGPRNWKLYGIAWGTIFTADFVGAILTSSLFNDPLESTIFSLTMMILAVVLIFFTPRYLESDIKVKGVLVLEDKNVVTKKGKNMDDIRELLTKNDIGGAEHIELEDGKKVVVSKHGKYTSAAIVNLHSISLVEKLQRFAREISKVEENEDIVDSLITDIFGKVEDDEGADVKYMEF